MPKTLPAQVITPMDAVRKAPILLFELGLSSTLRYAAYKTNVTFPTGGNVYTAKAIEISGVDQSLEGQINRVHVKFDDISNDMSAYANAEDFKGLSLIIKRVYVGVFGDASYYNEVFNGHMEEVDDYDYEWMTISATQGKSLSRSSIKFAYQRMCPWIFGGDECNTNSYADLTSLTATGTADSGTYTTLVDDALTQVNDYWNYGNLYITKSGIVYRRTVTDFDAATDTVTFDVELPFQVDGTCTYEVFKGCDKTWDTCSATNAWGPSADNSVNFGGCIHITTREDGTTERTRTGPRNIRGPLPR